MAAVTGTNGKTTTAFLTRSILEAAGRPCGLLGTIKQVVGGNEVTNPFVVTEVYVRDGEDWTLASLSFTRLVTR